MLNVFKDEEELILKKYEIIEMKMKMKNYFNLLNNMEQIGWKSQIIWKEEPGNKYARDMLMYLLYFFKI